MLTASILESLQIKFFLNFCLFEYVDLKMVASPAWSNVKPVSYVGFWFVLTDQLETAFNAQIAYADGSADKISKTQTSLKSNISFS